MLSEIQERLIEIIEGTPELGIQTYRYLPASLDSGNLPAVLILPRAANYEMSGAERFTNITTFDLRLYIAGLGTRLESINQLEPLEYLDLFASVFLSRLQLQFNDTGLTGVVGNIEFTNPTNLSRPIEYPIGNPNAPRFWGSTYQLLIPFRQAIALNPSGV